MSSSPFPHRPAPSVRQEDLYGAPRPPRTHTSTPLRTHPPNDSARTPRSILRHSHSSHSSPVHDPPANAPSRHPPPIPRSTTTLPYHHHHTSSSPELRPRADNAWAPRARPDLSQPSNPSSLPHSSSHFIPRPRPDDDDTPHRRTGFAARVNSYFVPGFRERSASDVRIAHTPPPDLEPDRLARACGQPAPSTRHRLDDRSRYPAHTSSPCSRKDSPAPLTDALPSHPPLPKARVGHMYRRLDALTRRSGHRAMDYISFEDVAVTHKRDSNLREQLRRKQSDRLQEMDPNFHAIGAPLDDVLLYASTPMLIGDYQHYLPVVVVACVEELTKTGIYQCGLFRALPSRDRHLQLIDLFDKSPDFGAQFNMRGQSMPDICALLSTFISSLPNPLLEAPIYSALWHWSVKPSVKREDARRDRQEEEEEDHRARGELPLRNTWVTGNELHLDDSDIALESDQLAIAQILLRFLPSANLSLLVYLCAFFTQLPLCPENGLQLEDIARIFGHRLLGGSTKIVSQRMMVWLLTRWHPISETLFGEMCGMTPPPSPRPEGFEIVGGEKRKGKRESGSDDVLCHATSSSSSTSPPTELPEDHGISSRKSSSGTEDEMDSSEGSRRRKKRELDVQAHTHAQESHRSSTRKEPRHGHVRRNSGSRRHHHHHHHHHRQRHSLEHKNSPPSPDPFAIAFARAQQDLADAPLLAASPSRAKITKQKRDMDDGSSSASPPPSPFTSVLDTPVRVARDERGGRTGVDAGVVNVLLEEAAGAAGVARALAERVEVLERALALRGQEHVLGRLDEDSLATPSGFTIAAIPPSLNTRVSIENNEGDRDDDDGRGSNGAEEGLRSQLRRVEAERDKAQQIVRDMRAYLLNEPGTLERD